MAYRLHVEKQSIFLDIDPKKRTVKGQTKFLLTIVEGFENKENQNNNKNFQGDNQKNVKKDGLDGFNELAKQQSMMGDPRIQNLQRNMSVLSDIDDRMIEEKMNLEGLDKDGIDKKEENVIPESMNMHLYAQQMNLTNIVYQKIQGDDLLNLREYYYMPPEKQALILSSILPTPVSIDQYIVTHRKCFENKEISGIQLFFDVDKELMQSAIDNQDENPNEDQNQNQVEALNYQGLLTVDYELENPVAGIRFLENERYVNTQESEFSDIQTVKINEIFVLTEYFVRCAQYWVPSLDREVFITDLNVMVQSDKTIFQKQEYDYLALCSGDLKEQLIDENGKILFKYSIQKKIKTDHIGICIGKFKTELSNFKTQKNNQVLIASSIGIDKKRLDVTLIHIESILKSIAQQQLQDLSEYLNIYKVIFLPNIFTQSHMSITVFEENDSNQTPFQSNKLIANSMYNYQENITKQFDYTLDQLPQGFFKLGFIDEFFLAPLLAQTQIEQNFRLLQYFKLINFSICQQKVSVGTRYHVDYWILIGVNGYMTDLYYKTLLSDKENAFEFRLLMAKQFEKLNYLVEQGEEVAPLSCADELTFGFEKFVDEVYILKARLIFHILAIKCNSKGSEFVNSILDSAEKDQKITTDYIFKFIHKNYSIKDKNFRKQFIECTGIPHFAFEYEDSRKENKISVQVTQTALQEEYFRYHNYYRNELEKKNNIHSNQMRMLENETIGEQGDSSDEEGEESKSQAHKDEKPKIITKDNLGNGRLIVPLILKSSRFFQGKLELIVSEVRDKDQQNVSIQKDDEIKMITLDKNHKFKRDVAYRSETRKNNGKKKEDDEDDSKKKQQGSKKKQDELEKVWIKIDPSNKYLLSLDFPQQNLHSLLTQLMKDKKHRYKYISVTLYLLRQLRNKNYEQDSYDIVKNLKLIIQKDDLETELQVEILDVIIRNSSKVKKARQECFNLLEELIKKNVIGQDKSLLPNNFQSYKKYMILMTIIRGLPYCYDENISVDADKQYPPENTIRYLLKLTKENDNSINRFDDSIYRANLIGSLLLTNHPYFKKAILKEVIRCLELEYIECSLNDVVFKAIIMNYYFFLMKNELICKNKFGEGEEDEIEDIKIEQNFKMVEEKDGQAKQTNGYSHTDKNGYSSENGINGYSKIKESKGVVIQTENQDLQVFIDQINQQISDFKIQKNQVNMKGIYLYDKFLRKEDSNSYLPHQMFMYLIKKIEKARLNFVKCQDYINYLAILKQYVHVNINSFVEDMQFKLDYHQNMLFAQVIWEQLVSSASLVNPYVRLYWIKMYRDIYFHWAPFCTILRKLYVQEEEDIGFCVDKNWINWSKSDGDKKDQSDEQKYRQIFKQKKRKRINSEINIKDQILSFCKKDKGNFNVIRISKFILDFLIKQTDHQNKMNQELSQSQTNGVMDANSNNITINVKLQTFKQVKRSLKKDKYKTFEEVKRQTLQIPDEYQNQQKINSKQCTLLKELINHCFDTAQEIYDGHLKKQKNIVIDNSNQMIQQQYKSQIKSLVPPAQGQPQRRVSIQEEKNRIHFN
ncbi:hypothetical protein ABPG74_014955 [Tetrahymena malaccensis]